MARRKDGTARRYEFQLFDDPEGQGRAIYQAISAVQDRGISAAAFIRTALLFYIEHEHQQRHDPEPPGTLAALLPDASRPAEQPGLTPDVIRDILRSELGKLPASVLKPDDSGGDNSSGGLPGGGLDMSPRRRNGPPKAVHAPQAAPAIAEPALTPEDSARMLVASVKAFGRTLPTGRPG